MAQMLTLAAKPDRCHLIDGRDAEDSAAAHVAEAVRVPLADLAARVSEIPAGKTPVAICGKGRRAVRRGRGHPETRPPNRPLARRWYERLACAEHLNTKKPEMAMTALTMPALSLARRPATASYLQPAGHRLISISASGASLLHAG